MRGIVMIEYHGDHPFSATTLQDGGGYRHWDIEKSNRDGWMRYCSGYGGRPSLGSIEYPPERRPDIYAPIWRELGVYDTERREYRRDWETITQFANLIDEPRMPEEWETPDFRDECKENLYGFHFCPLCDDHYDSEEYCKHLLAVDTYGACGVGSYSGDGSLDEDEYRERVQLVFDKAPNTDLRDHLILAFERGETPCFQFHGSMLGPTYIEVRSRSIPYTYDGFPYAYDNADDPDFMAGLAWLFTSQFGTPEQRAKTLQWLREHRNKSLSRMVHS